jgi:hypothetical protein
MDEMKQCGLFPQCHSPRESASESRPPRLRGKPPGLRGMQLMNYLGLRSQRFPERSSLTNILTAFLGLHCKSDITDIGVDV